MGRRSDHSREELQQLIVNTSLELIKEHGANKVTARQIATAVGYTPGTLYSVFINLQDIFLHVNELGLSTLYELCEEAISSEQDPQQAIQCLGLAYLKFATEHTHQFDLMFARTDSSEPDAPVPIQNRIVSMFGLIEEQLKRLNPNANDADVKLSARALWSGVHGAAMLNLSGQLYLDSAKSEKQLVGTLIDNFLDSWKKS